VLQQIGLGLLKLRLYVLERSRCVAYRPLQVLDYIPAPSSKLLAFDLLRTEACKLPGKRLELPRAQQVGEKRTGVS
jgi:hypothetical protein